jgi:hypothetical protein
MRRQTIIVVAIYLVVFNVVVTAITMVVVYLN